MTTIKLKNGSGAPLAGDLVQGEPALDLTNKRLYTEDSGGTVIEVGTNPTSLTTGTFTSTGIDDNAASTAITIDASQNLLVSKTSTGVGTAGLELRADGLLAATRSGSNVGVFRRLTDDGSIIDFQNSGGTTVGSIANRGTNLSVGSGDVALEFNASNDAVLPASTSTNNTRDAAVDLGMSAVRFKDLHLSGATKLASGSSIDFGSRGNLTHSASTYDMVFNTNSLANTLVIKGTGLVGIGTSNPSTKLHLGGTAPGDSIIRQDSTASGTNWEIGEREAGKWQIFEDDGDSIVATFTSSGNVGIGTSSPSTYDSRANNLVVGDSGDAGVTIFSGSTSNARLQFAPSGATGLDNGLIDYDNNNDSMSFATGGSERMRIDASGNLLVGTTDDVVQTNSGTGNGGIVLRNNNYVAVASDGSAALELNRLASDGEIANFRKDGTTVGSIGTSTFLYLAGGSSGGTHAGIRFINDQSIRPCTSTGDNLDNTLDLGVGTARWDDIYATNGTIQTSDRNEKQDIEALSDAEQRVAVAAKGLLRKFRWIDSVEAKGDDARIHFGIIAQDLQDAFTAEGLDAGRYAMFISSTWWESTEVIPAVEAQEAVVDEEGNVVEEAVEAQEERTVVHTHQTAEEAPEGSVERTRLGVRYSELLAFIIAAI